MLISTVDKLIVNCLGVTGKSPHVAGEGLVKAMEVVPNMFFSEEFSLSRYASYGLLLLPVAGFGLTVWSSGLSVVLFDGCRPDTWQMRIARGFCAFVGGTFPGKGVMVGGCGARQGTSKTRGGFRQFLT